MSAALVLMPCVLPRLYATASVGEAAYRVHEARTERNPLVRKGPQSLRLVQAAATPVTRPMATSRPLRVQPEFAFYRKYTEGMLRRYMKMSMEAGRVPSMLGRDMFRGRVTSCRVNGFDDAVIFVEDVNKCLARLEAGQRFLVRKVALEGYTLVEAAAMHGIALRTVARRYTEAIDRLTRMFIDRELMHVMTDPGVSG